jgi:hypothetical protein
MQRVEVKFTHGQLRQPGLWGKVLLVNGGINAYENEKDYDLSFEHQFAGHLARFEGKNVLLQTLSETDLKPIYEALANAKYAHLDRFKATLRHEGLDKNKD